jgi:hypothetical protein
MILVILAAAALDLAANWLAAHYLIPIGPFLIPAGTFAFALSFTIYDFLRRQGGIAPAMAAMVLGFVASIVYTPVFGGAVGRIALAGLAALACSSTVELLAQTVTLRWPIWRYVLASNATSLAIDTLVFSLIAFAGNPHLLNIITGQYLAKLAMTAVAIPLVYAGRRWLPMTNTAVLA